MFQSLIQTVPIISKDFKYQYCWQAAEAGDLEELRSMYDKGHNSIDYRVTEFAAKNGHLDCLAFALERGSSRNGFSNPDGVTCYMAALNGHLECLKLAFSRGCSLGYTQWNADERTQLFASSAAIENNHIDCLRFVHSKGCPIEEQSIDLAANRNYIDCFEFCFQVHNNKQSFWKSQYDHLIEILDFTKSVWRDLYKLDLSQYQQLQNIINDNKLKIEQNLLEFKYDFSPVNNFAANSFTIKLATKNVNKIIDIILKSCDDNQVDYKYFNNRIDCSYINEYGDEVDFIITLSSDCTIYIERSFFKNSCFINYNNIINLLKFSILTHLKEITYDEPVKFTEDIDLIRECIRDLKLPINERIEWLAKSFFFDNGDKQYAANIDNFLQTRIYSSISNYTENNVSRYCLFIYFNCLKNKVVMSHNFSQAINKLSNIKSNSSWTKKIIKCIQSLC